MNIRRLNNNDIQQVVELAKDWQGPQFNWPSPLLLQEFEIAECFGIFDSSQPSLLLAFVMVCDRTVAWEISCLATRKNHQKKGLMKQLLKFLFTEIGLEKELWLEVHENNLAARNLYEKLGFQQTGTRAAYYKDGGAALLYTWRFS